MRANPTGQKLPRNGNRPSAAAALPIHPDLALDTRPGGPLRQLETPHMIPKRIWLVTEGEL